MVWQTLGSSMGADFTVFFLGQRTNSPLLLLEVGPQNTALGLAEYCKLPSGV